MIIMTIIITIIIIIIIIITIPPFILTSLIKDFSFLIEAPWVGVCAPFNSSKARSFVSCWSRSSYSNRGILGLLGLWDPVGPMGS